MSENIAATTHNIPIRDFLCQYETISLFYESNRIDAGFFFSFCNELEDFKAIDSTKWFCVLRSTMSTFQSLSHKTKETTHCVSVHCTHFEKEIVVCHLRRPWWCWYGVKSNFPVRSLSDYGGDGVAGKNMHTSPHHSLYFPANVCLITVSIIWLLSIPLPRGRYFCKWFITLLLSLTHTKAVLRQWRICGIESESECEWMMRYEARTLGSQ